MQTSPPGKQGIRWHAPRRAATTPARRARRARRLAYPRPVSLPSRLGRCLAAAAAAFLAAAAGAFFLIENVRAGGAVVVTAIVGLAAFLAYSAPNPSARRGQSLRVLFVSSAAAIVVGVAGFAAAILLLAASRSG